MAHRERATVHRLHGRIALAEDMHLDSAGLAAQLHFYFDRTSLARNLWENCARVQASYTAQTRPKTSLRIA